MTTQDVITAWTTESNYCAPRKDYYFNLSKNYPIATQPRKHDMLLLMSLGRRFPGTKTHAKYWISNGCNFDVISTHEILPVANYCEMIGVTPDFTFTKSKNFVRLGNSVEVNAAIKNYFSK